MKKLAFIFGYAGSIVAIVLSLLMVYTVPASIVENTIDEMSDDLENVHIVAMNDVALAAIEQDADVLSETEMREIARDVAEKNEYITERTYLQAVTFAFDKGRDGVLAIVMIGVTFVFALISFIGALICKKLPQLGGVFIVISALVMLLTSIATDTLVPMIFAFALLLVSGVVAFVHPRETRAAYATSSIPYPPMQSGLQPMQAGAEGSSAQEQTPVSDNDDKVFSEDIGSIEKATVLPQEMAIDNETEFSETIGGFEDESSAAFAVESDIEAVPAENAQVETEKPQA